MLLLLTPKKKHVAGSLHLPRELPKHVSGCMQDTYNFDKKLDLHGRLDSVQVLRELN